jgi:hypothetical protein
MRTVCTVRFTGHANELEDYSLDVVGLQEIVWDKGGTEWAED